MATNNRQSTSSQNDSAKNNSQSWDKGERRDSYQNDTGTKAGHSKNDMKGASSPSSGFDTSRDWSHDRNRNDDWDSDPGEST